jgi:uncharacterized protein
LRSHSIKVACAVVLGFLIITVLENLTPEINEIEISLAGNTASEFELKIALLSDLHIGADSQSLKDIAMLWQEVLQTSPDVIMLAGDYVNNGGAATDFSRHREEVAAILGATDNIPVIAVLGNHEEWSEPHLWAKAFHNAGIQVLENDVMELAQLSLCVRGFSDAFTGQFEYVDYPSACDGRIKVSLTHDPAGAFHSGVSGLVLAGHTHCGQIRLPLLGPLYVPSDAPKRGHCGLYIDGQRQVFVSSGVGTSVLPIRFLAQAQWDLITLR